MSYAHDDAELVYPEIHRLREAGLNIWYDEGISPGATWRDEVALALTQCKVFLYFITPRSASSSNCLKEVNFSLSRERKTLAVHLEPTELPVGLELSLSDMHARAGIETELGENVCFGISFHIAETQERAIAQARPFYEEHAKMFGPLGFLGRLSDEQIAALGERGGVTKAGIATLEDSSAAGAWYCGPASALVERLQELGERFPGVTAVNVQSSMGTPQAIMVEQLEWFARDVMPAFR